LSIHVNRKIDKFIIHCSATRADQPNINAETIRKWHRDKGWSDIGYHYVILRDGTLEEGRPLEIVGAHCEGQNAHSVGICMIGGLGKDGKGEDNFLPLQWKMLEGLIRSLKSVHKNVTIHGHREFNAGKECPSFDVQKWLKEVKL
jgi:hypothetical protein